MIKSIAARAGMSTSTVRRALQGKPDISDSTKETIGKIAAEMHYRPNFLARAMITKKTNLIGFLVPEIFSTFYPLIINSFEKAAAEKGFRILISTYDYDEKKFLNALMIFRQYQVDGLAAVPPKNILSPETEKELADFSQPVLFIDENINGSADKINFPWIGSADHAGAYSAVEYFLAKGITKIFFAGLNKDSSSSINRFNGYHSAIADRNIKIDDGLIFPGDYSFSTGAGAGNLIVRNKSYPCGVLCGNDEIAAGLINVLRAHGVRIPIDVSVIGFGNLRFSEYMLVPLTTVDQCAERMGADAFAFLHELIIGEKPADLKRQIPTSVIIRESA